MKQVKAALTAFLSVLSGWLGILAFLIPLLVLCNIIDYSTGLMAGPKRGEKISSYKSFKGIAKKICQWLLIIVGAIMDQLVKYGLGALGIVLPFTFLIASIVTIWLIINEIISTLENMLDIGVSMPPFLLPIAKYIKKQVEDKATVKEDIKQ
jgi:toxin secretion/phage lysis holin